VGGFSTSSEQVLGNLRHALSVSRRIGRRAAILGALLVVCSAATIGAATNTPPQITGASVSPAVTQEGGTVTLTGTFTDPDVGDAHVIRIYWADGSPAQKVQLPAGQFSFQVPHTFIDNIPGTSVVVAVADHQLPVGSNDNTEGQGQDARHVPVQVKNVAPRFAPGVTVTKVPKIPGKVVIDGDLIDPSKDRVTVSANFGDGIPPHPFPPKPVGTSPCTVDGRRFHCAHQYAVQFPPKTFSIALLARDDDGGTGTFTTSVQIPY